MERNPLLIPDPVIIGRVYAKGVAARVKIRIRRQTALGVGVLPLLIEPFEFVGVTVFLWGSEVQSCKLKVKVKDRLVVAESDM